MSTYRDYDPDESEESLLRRWNDAKRTLLEMQWRERAAAEARWPRWFDGRLADYMAHWRRRQRAIRALFEKPGRFHPMFVALKRRRM